MNTLATARSRRAGGFTLIELMITMVIAALLLSVTVPLYMNQIRKSRRTEAKTAVLDLAGREERLFSVNNAYSATPADLGYGAVGATFPMNTVNGYYQMTVAIAAGPPTFTVTATAISTDQLKDTNCRTYTVNQLGVQTAADSTGTTSAAITSACWR